MTRQLLTAAALMIAGAGCAQAPSLRGAEGDLGTLLFADEPPGGDLNVERSVGGDWEIVIEGAEGGQWWVETVAGARYRLSDPKQKRPGEALTPDPLTLDFEIAGPFVEAGAPLGVRVAIDGPEGVSGGLLFDAFGGGVGIFPVDDLAGFVLDLSDNPNPIDTLSLETLSFELTTEAGEPLASASASYISWPDGWAWGDVHAHSNLSMDGCEVPEENCANRELLAGEDFFEQADARGMDFAAITDHAEYFTWIPEDDGPELLIWDAQVDLAREAEGGPVMPLLGYEWTFSATQEPGPDGHYVGGHKTVLLPDLTGCESARISSEEDVLSYLKADRGALFRGGNPYTAVGVTSLWDLLDASECAEGAITFFHHSAYEWPQPVDFTLEQNTPDPRYERLIEIYSEHGSSECLDLSAPHCDWNLRSASRYWGQGSVQMALSLGYQLGFVAGTDSHDSMPGSTDDDPSCTARWSDTDGDGQVDTPSCQDWPGGVTGVLVPEDFDQADLFDAMRDRRTVASSGPRPSLYAVVLGPDGELWLPGEVIDADGPVRVLVSLEPGEDALGVVALELIDALGQLRASAAADTLDSEIDLLPGEAVYLRARLEDDQRLWASPWFGPADDGTATD